MAKLLQGAGWLSRGSGKVKSNYADYYRGYWMKIIEIKLKSKVNLKMKFSLYFIENKDKCIKVIGILTINELINA